jgi:hypothetical protein
MTRTTETFWTFESILGHQGPLDRSDQRYKGSSYNVLVKWQQDSSTTWEPLNRMMEDDPVTCAAYAREKGLLDTPGWKSLKKKQRQDEEMGGGDRTSDASSERHCEQVEAISREGNQDQATKLVALQYQLRHDSRPTTTASMTTTVDEEETFEGSTTTTGRKRDQAEHDSEAAATGTHKRSKKSNGVLNLWQVVLGIERSSTEAKAIIQRAAKDLPKAVRRYAENIMHFFLFVYERQAIWERRQQGCPEDAWTKSRAMVDYHFCNVS